MSKHLLPIPHRTEAFTGACLPACCQMALAFYGISKSQAKIAEQIGHVEGAGTPAGNVVHLVAFGVKVKWNEQGEIEQLQKALDDGKATIVFLYTGELPYWNFNTPHALIVVGIESDLIYVNDPAFENAPIPVSVGDFELAWDEFGRQWATVGAKNAR